jgi:hypothetical protein
MGLINLQTNLKSLRFGNDRFGNGNSGQPYIQTPIPDQLPRSGTEDFILRGGLNTIEDSATDVLRLGKYFADPRNPDGLLFIAKQNLLSRTAVRTQSSTGILNEGIYTPISTLVEAGGVAFGLHVNKQGLNPFLGIGEVYTPQRYFDAVRETNFVDTPLLTNINIQGVGSQNFSPLNIPLGNIVGDIRNRLIGKYQDLIIGDSPNQQNILTYQGGPGSFLGVGQTNIKFATGNDDSPNSARTGINNTKGKEIVNGTYLTSKKLINLDGNKLLGTSEKVFTGPLPPSENGFTPEGKIDSSRRLIGSLDNPDQTQSTTLTAVSYNNRTYTYSQNQLDTIPKETNGTDGISYYIGNLKTTTGIGDFRALLRSKATDNQKIDNKIVGNITNAPNYFTKNIEKRVNLGDPGDTNLKDLTSYTNGYTPPNPSEGKSGGNASPNSYDKINVLPIYKSNGPSQAKINDNAITNDLIKFRIGVIDNNNPGKKAYIHFRAFLNQISDGYTADWASTQYIGRGEKFYNYTGFDRKVSLSWTVAAQSKAELIPMYKKLNYLASVCAPDYSGNGYLRGNIVTLTIGGYFYEQPGIITGFSYEMNDDNATWEIGINDANEGGNDSSVKELPHLIKVTGFNFIPIHNFVPRLQQNNFGTLNPDNVLIDGNTYGPERYIALSNGENNNYSKNA